jgi:hypothetical protein
VEAIPRIAIEDVQFTTDFPRPPGASLRSF